MCKVCDIRKTFAPGASESTVGMEEKDAVTESLKASVTDAKGHLAAFSACVQLVGLRAAMNTAVGTLSALSHDDLTNLAVILLVNVWDTRESSRNASAALNNIVGAMLGKQN